MAEKDKYWSLIDEIWDELEIYETPAVFLSSFSKVRREAGLVYTAHFCQAEVSKGGFERFFANSTGIFAPESVEGFKAIGQAGVAEVVDQAIAVLGQPYVREREVREAAMWKLPDGSFKELNDRFLGLIDNEAGGFKTAANDYAAQNPS